MQLTTTTDIVNLGSRIRLPKSSIPVEAVKKDLTYTSPYDEDSVNILQYVEDDDYLYVPRRYESPYINKNVMVDQSITNPVNFPYTKLPDPFHPKVLDKKAQKDFMDDMLTQVKNLHCILCEAVTGSGKTTVGLNTAALLGQKTVVVVPSVELKNNWIKEIEDKLGIPSTEVGLIQGTVDTSERKSNLNCYLTDISPQKPY